MTFNLIEEEWIPVRTRSGREIRIAPGQITKDYQTDPVATLNSARPDFNGALIQFLIGLVQTCFAPEDNVHWGALLKNSPSEECLHEAFCKVAHAFNLDGDGPRFMQDLTLTRADGEEKQVQTLLIDAPGRNTIEENKDHFIKRDQVRQLCAGCAASALLSLQTNAPSGGAGHRTSLRGGGPMTTLVVGLEDVLWDVVWSNILDQRVFPGTSAAPRAVKDEHIFPWLAPTRTSEGKTGRSTTPADAAPAQMFWGMPRRIRLDFNLGMAGHCHLCRETSNYMVQRYLAKSHGVNYEGAWKHPLTPHIHHDSGASLPRHGQPGGINYRHWLGLVQSNSTKKADPAAVVSRYLNHAPLDRPGTRLWAFGFDMDNMKARCWYERTMLVPHVQDDLRKDYELFVEKLVLAAEAILSNLRTCLKEAWFKRPKDVKGDTTFIDAEFWHNTEPPFCAAVVNLPAEIEEAPEVSSILDAWYARLCREALHVFDRHTASSPLEHADLKRIALARNKLRAFNGGKYIREKILGLPPRAKK